MHLVDSRHGLALCLSLAFAAAACAAPTIPDDTRGEDLTETEPSAPPKKKNDTSKTGDDDKTGPATPGGQGQPEGQTPPGGSPEPAKDCSSSANADACYQCCDPTNAVEPAMQAFGECACATPGVCASACGTTFCAGQAPNAACEACLNGATQCETAADAACGAACKAAVACEEASKCFEKP